MGRSSTDLAVVPAGGKFGPFDGQLMVAEFPDAKVSRVFLEKVDVEYQGATFPFLASFASGIVRLILARHEGRRPPARALERRDALRDPRMRAKPTASSLSSPRPWTPPPPPIPRPTR
jgi:hypothetical protein